MDMGRASGRRERMARREGACMGARLTLIMM
jgi:hypothetical protein